MTRPIVLLLALSACGGPSADDKDDVVTDDTDLDTDADSGVTAACGNGVVEADEACDDGDANGPEANCLEDCSFNPDQRYVVRIADLEPLGDDAPPVTGVTDAEAPLGTGAWAYDGTTAGEKLELFVDPLLEEVAALGAVDVGDIVAFSYATKTPESAGRLDVYAAIYTQPDLDDDQGLFYGERLTGEPVYARARSETPGWTTWSTGGPADQLTFYDGDRTGVFGYASGQPTWSEVTAAPFDWSTVDAELAPTAVDYAAEQVKFLSLQTASSWSDGFQVELDAIRLELADGRTFEVDLEP